MLSQADALREQYKLRLAEEIEKIKNPVPVVTSPSLLARPSSVTSSVLSHEAAEFVPSFPVPDTSSSWQYPAYYNTYDTQYNYSGDSYYFHPVHEDGEVGDSLALPSEGHIWGNMLNILKN